MKDFVKLMIEEHKELNARIIRLNGFINSEATNNIHRVEYANLALQLSYMQKYFDILTVRLSNQNVEFVDGEYFEHINIDVSPNNDEKRNLPGKEA